MESRPLTGLRVLDLSRMVSGPLCGRMLADLGADVVKIEPPDRDRTSTVPPFVGGVSPYYAQMNAGKRNVCVDLKAPGGPRWLRAWRRVRMCFSRTSGPVSWSGTTLMPIRYCSRIRAWCIARSAGGVSPVGGVIGERSHPLSTRTSGRSSAARHRDRRPEPEINQHGDVYPAVVATSAVLAALLQRVTTGRGQHLDVAMGQAAFYVNEWAATDLQPPVDDFAGFDTWNQYTYRLGDGSYVALVGNPVNLFPLWVRGFGGDEALLTDSRFVTLAARRAHVSEMNEVVEGLTGRFADFTALEEAMDDPWMLMAQVRSTAEFATTDWATERGLTSDVAPGLPVPAAPWQSSEATIGYPTSVSALGADNRAVLVEAGYSNDEVDDLTRAGVLRDGSDTEPTRGRPDAT